MAPPGPGSGSSGLFGFPRSIEKLPLFAVAGAVSLLTWVAQRQGGAVATLADVSLTRRLGQTSIAVVTYPWKLFVPTGLKYPDDDV